LWNLEGGFGGQSLRCVIELVEGASEKVLLDVLLEYSLGRFSSPWIAAMTE